MKKPACIVVLRFMTAGAPSFAGIFTAVFAAKAERGCPIPQTVSDVTSKARKVRRKWLRRIF